jgi:hypothetical protein
MSREAMATRDRVQSVVDANDSCIRWDKGVTRMITRCWYFIKKEKDQKNQDGKKGEKYKKCAA